MSENKTESVIHIVKPGDTLPDLCQAIYGQDCSSQVAQYNNLNKYRNLNPGTQLVFPPLVEIAGS